MLAVHHVLLDGQSMRACARACICVCVCVTVCEREEESEHHVRPRGGSNGASKHCSHQNTEHCTVLSL